ncbi:MAG: Ig-like domain-containing protein [bacterium]
MTTKLRQKIVVGLFGFICVAGTFILTGCDTASSTEELVISPSSVTLSSGQSQTFSVSGGYHYNWALEGSGSSSGSTSSAQGSLSSLTGSQVLYTAPSSDTLSGSVTLKVTSTIPGSGSSTSNSAEYSVTGSAQINFKSAGSSSSSAPMTIAPTLVTVAPGSSVTFTGSGGALSYTWTVSNSSLGSITGASGSGATYSASAPGTNTITCTDSDGNRVTATVYQHF